MALQVAATEWLSKSMRGLGELLAATGGFQALTGKDAENSLLDHIAWPDAAQLLDNQALPVPMALITFEQGMESEATWPRLRTGQLLLQIAVTDDQTLTDKRDRFTKAANEVGLVMREALEDAQANQSMSWMNSYSMHEPSELNDLKKFTFKNDAGDVVRARVFTFVIGWKG